MKIKNKLTILYTVIIAFILVCLNLYIYILASSFIKNNFYAQLKDRAIITATIFLERDEQSATIIHSFEKKYLRSLPDEIIRVYNEQNEPVFIDSADFHTYDPALINLIKKEREYHFEKNDRQVVGIYYEDNQGNFVIIASAVNDVGINNLNQLRKILFFGFLASIILVLLSGRYFTRIMFRPVTDITLQANKISETNLHLRLSEGNKKDELAQLSLTINRMLERLEKAFELQKDFVGNASHELRTPLTSIIGNIEVTLAKARTVDDYKTVLLSILNEAEKLQKLSNGLLNLAQSNLDFSNLRKEEIRLDELLMEIKDEMKVKREGCAIELVFTGMPENSSLLTISGDKNLLETALLNLTDNACKFSDGKKVTVTLSLLNEGINILISDIGIGISERELPHVTETFFRADNARPYSGSGIGLALTEKIILLHGGSIHIASELNVGTRVTILFPSRETSVRF